MKNSQKRSGGGAQKAVWRHVPCILLFCLLLLTKMFTPAFAEEVTVIPDNPIVPPERQQGAGSVNYRTSAPVRLGEYNLHLFPSGDFYRPYAADPYRTGFGIQRLHVFDGGISNTGKSRYALRAGGFFGIARIQPGDDSDVGVQLNIGGGMDGQFDLDYFEDNIGWNGHYGMTLTAASGRALTYKLGLQHISGHIGDEFIERTGQGRIGYTRMELFSGVSWAIDRHWRTYTEAGWGYELNNRQLQKPGRVQFGVEYERLLWRNLGCYAAVNSSAMQERAWRFDNTLQLGLVSHSDHRTWRFGFEISKGRPTMSEYFTGTEAYTSFGLWLDL